MLENNVTGIQKKKIICEELFEQKKLIWAVINVDYEVPIIQLTILKVHSQLTELTKINKCGECTCCEVLKKLTACLYPSNEIEEIRSMVKEVKKALP